MKQYLVIRRLRTGLGETSHIASSHALQVQADTEKRELDAEIGAAGGYRILGPDGKVVGTLGQFLVGLGITGVAHHVLEVEPASAIIKPPEARIIQ